MKKSQQTRVQQRLKIMRLGQILVKMAVFLGILGLVFTTFNATGLGLTFAGIAAVIAPFGAILTMMFGKEG